MCLFDLLERDEWSVRQVAVRMARILKVIHPASLRLILAYPLPPTFGPCLHDSAALVLPASPDTSP